MLTQDELKLVIDACETYPAGVHTSSWGSTPDFITPNGFGTYPENIPTELMRQYG